MKLVYRSYSGKKFKPTPIISEQEEQGLLIIATPWGSREASENQIEIIENYYLAAVEDVDSTIPFARLDCLSTMQNNLRTAFKLANDYGIKEFNKKDYLCGTEVVAVAWNAHEISVCQVGHPLVFLKKQNNEFLPLSTQPDLAYELSGSQQLDPLPNSLLGTHFTVHLNINSLKIHPGDQLVFLSRSFAPGQFIAYQKKTLEALTHILSKNNEDLPFWIGIKEF